MLRDFTINSLTLFENLQLSISNSPKSLTLPHSISFFIIVICLLKKKKTKLLLVKLYNYYQNSL